SHCSHRCAPSACSSAAPAPGLGSQSRRARPSRRCSKERSSPLERRVPPPCARPIVKAMNEQWSDPSRVLAAVERIMRAPRCEILTGFSREVATLVPHRAAAMRTGGCPREPIKRSGQAALPGLVTGAELARLDAVVEPGGARVVEGVLGGAAGPLAVVKSGLGKASDALLVLGPLEEAVPGEAALELVARLWNVLVLDASRRVDAVPPGTVAENLAIAAARSRAIADMEQTHAERSEEHTSELQ